MSSQQPDASSLISEKELQSTILGWSKAYGWLVYHQVDQGWQDPENPEKRRFSKRIGPGFPDLVLVHPVWGRLIFAELKSDKEKPKPHQQEWLDALENARSTTKPGHTHEVYVWKPRDMPEIERILSNQGA